MQEEDNFYIVLPSNETSPEYPNNKTSHYFTALPHPLNLKGEWEVALVDFYYPHTWYNIDFMPLETFEVFLDENKNESLPPSTHDIHWTRSRQNNKDYRIRTISGNITSGFYKTSNELIPELNERFKPILKITQNHLNGKVSVHFNIAIGGIFITEKLRSILGLPPIPQSGTAKTERPFLYGNVSGTDRTFLGCELRDVADEDFYTAVPDNYFTGTNSVDLDSVNLHICTDLVRPSHFGDFLAPLLRIVHTSRKNAGKYVGTAFDDPHYISLASNYINRIEIAVRSNGEALVPFQYGTVLVKLHFRRRR